MEHEKINNYIEFILGDSSRPVAILNLDGTINQVNGQFRENFGCEKIHSMNELLEGNSMTLLANFFKKLNEKEHDAFTIRINLTSNKVKCVKVRLLYANEINKVIATFEMPLNIDGEIKSMYSSLLSESDDLIFLVNQKGIICDVNNHTYRFLNSPREYFIGKKREEIMAVDSDRSDEYANYINKAIVEGRAELLVEYKYSPGDIRYYNITSFFDDKTRMFLVRISDHTEKVNLKKRLAHKESLSKVGELAASIAHEIRNPMTTLKGFTQLLKASATEEAKKYLNVIDDEIERMETILSEMLVMSKPRINDKVNLSLKDLLSDMIRVISPKAHFEGIAIVQKEDMHSDALICGDEAKLKQVILNLLKNGIEAMSPGDTLTTDVEKGVDGRLNLSITDTGKGMSPAEIKEIFRPFFTTRSEGTGLGLSFVNQIVEDHGGTIRVESEIGVGSKFTLTFPIISEYESNSLLEKRVLATS